MSRRNPFKQHRFPRDVILLAVRWYCRYPLSYRDMRDLLAERGITADAATIYRWVQKFGQEIRKRAYGAHRSWRGLQWHVDETYVRVNGRWCYLWRAVDQRGQLIDFRLTARRNAVSIRRRPWARRIDQRRLGAAFGLRGFGAHFLARRSKLSRMRPISASSGSNCPPYHSSIWLCSSCLGSAMASRKSA